jgi:acyl-CoA synthetase (AMP-forming)/AMP-acid ligase II
MNIAEVLRDRARDLGRQPAIVDRGAAVSFDELDRAAARAAAELGRAGLKPGDRALVFQPMSIRLYVVLVGLFRLGVTAVFLDPAAGRRHIDRCCRLAQPRAFIATPAAHLLRAVSTAIRCIPIKLGAGAAPGVSSGKSDSADALIQPCATETPALLTFTSGSTGEPKGTMRTHGFLLAQHRVLEEHLELERGDVDLSTLPVFVLANLASGVTSVIADADLRRPGAIDPGRLLAQITARRPTRVVASPALLNRLASHARSRHTTLDSFQQIFTGGAPVFPRQLQELREVAPQATITAVYGSTEAEPIARINLEEIASGDLEAMRQGAGLLAGRPVPAVSLRIIADQWGRTAGPLDFDARPLSAGKVGEIAVAGDHVLTGYLNGAGDEDTKFRAGGRVWHRTGDAGYLDDRERLWLMGRCSARIVDAFGTVYPFAVECAAQDLAGVRRAALVARRGQRLLVVETDGVAPWATRAALTEALRWAALSDVLIVDRIPVDRRHNAKVDYPALRRMMHSTLTLS